MISFEKCYEAVGRSIVAKVDGKVVNSFLVETIEQTDKGFDLIEFKKKGADMYRRLEVTGIQIATLLKGKSFDKKIRENKVIITLEKIGSNN